MPSCDVTAPLRHRAPSGMCLRVWNCCEYGAWAEVETGVCFGLLRIASCLVHERGPWGVASAPRGSEPGDLRLDVHDLDLERQQYHQLLARGLVGPRSAGLWPPGWVRPSEVTKRFFEEVFRSDPDQKG